jgi:hypothetical protein
MILRENIDLIDGFAIDLEEIVENGQYLICLKLYFVVGCLGNSLGDQHTP